MDKRPHHHHTECDTRYARIKCLDFIVDAVTRLEEECSRKLRIVEVGCGNGNISLPLGSLGHHVLATDVDLESIECAKRKNRFTNVRFLVADGETLHMRRGFDVVIASEVLEHVRNPGNLISVCRRLMDPEGILILTVPNGYGPCELAIAGLGLGGRILKRLHVHRLLDYIKTTFFEGVKQVSYISSNPESRHVQSFTLRRIRNLLSSAGIRIEAMGHSDFLTPVVELVRRFELPDRAHYADWWIADRLPPFMVSGWYFLCRAG